MNQLKTENKVSETSPNVNSPVGYFTGRQLVIATMHGKEKVIAPQLEEKLGVTCFVPEHFDSDQLGTFTGEIQRHRNALDTARSKCLKAMEITGCGLGIASEGSFGPHPTLWFAPADDEILILIDTENNLEISVRELSTDTNFNASEIRSEKELLQFATECGFPEHGLILRKNASETTDIFKGIRDKKLLLSAFRMLLRKYGSVYAETDMRAMHNPKRMSVIAAAAEKLAARLLSKCPACHSPGFGISDRRAGLPCSNCLMPTKGTIALVHSCIKCSYSTEQLYPHAKKFEDPMYCDLCNP